MVRGQGRTRLSWSRHSVSLWRRSGRKEAEDETASELLETLQDEDFEDALEMLVDEAAALDLSQYGAWSAPPSATDSLGALEEWIAPLAMESERAIDVLAEGLAGADLYGLSGRDLDELFESFGETPHLGSEGFDQFLGGVLGKAKKLVGGVVKAARKGIAAVGKMLPISVLLGKLKGLVRPLLSRVLQVAMNLAARVGAADRHNIGQEVRPRRSAVRQRRRRDVGGEL